ncbi:YbbR-like domain-containing protein [Leuconostoc pseudomesenteroides]|uniref:CdaR family protein n=1 Tax=Leuconostoc pseudomesenteroides TaxID=33968 RepID=UPI0039ED4200
MKMIGHSKTVNLVVSLVMAILLSAYVLSTRSTTTNGSGSGNFSTLVPEKRATLSVPLNLQFDSDKYVIVGAPSSVKVGIEGSIALVAAAQNRNDIQASADLRGLGVGKHTVKLALRGVNASLTSTVTPQTITVTIARRKTATVPVKVTYDHTKIASGYAVSGTSVDPKSVKISGPKANVEAVTSIEAAISLDNNTKSTVNKSVKLVARDKNGAAVEVNIDGNSANVTLNVGPEDSKKLSLSATLKNANGANYTVTFDPKTVTAYGASDILNSISSLSVPVDVANITSKTTVSVDLPDQTGIDHYSVTKVQATVTPATDSSTSSSSSSSSSADSSSTSSSSSSSSESSSQSSSSSSQK